MKRAGFTMIELIFVIVILGILSAVALPRFIGVSEQAKAGKCKAFVGTLNRTVLPAIWSSAMADGAATNAAVRAYFNDGNVSAQVQTPVECVLTNSYATVAASTVGGTNGTVVLGGVTYTVDVNTSASVNNSPILNWHK